MLADHIYELIEKHDLDYEVSDDLYDAQACPGWVCFPEVIDSRTYYIALHEIAHAIDPGSWNDGEDVVEEEVNAWRWAITNGKVGMDVDAQAWMGFALSGYLIDHAAA